MNASARTEKPCGGARTVGRRALLFIYPAALSLACRHAPGGELKTDQTKETRAHEARSDAAKPESADAHDAAAVHRRAVAIDMHADTVQFMLDEGADINGRLTTTHLDAVRMREGGLDAQFFSIWVEPVRGVRIRLRPARTPLRRIATPLRRA